MGPSRDRGPKVPDRTKASAGACANRPRLRRSVILDGVGRDVEPLPPIEMLGLDDADPPVERVRVGVGARRRRAVLLLAAVGGAALVVGLLVGGGDAGSGDSSDRPGVGPTAGESGPAPSTAADSVPTTMRVGEPGAVFGSPVGASLLVGSKRGGWRALDLDTGIVRDVPELAGSAPDEIVPVRGGVVRLERVESPLTFVPVPVGASQDLAFGTPDPPRLSWVVGVIPTGVPDRLWMRWGLMDPGSSGTIAAMTDLQGLPVTDEITVEGAPIAGTMAGLVFSAGGRTYLNDLDGVRLLSDGVGYAASATEVAVLTCDEVAACWPRVIEVASGRSRRGPTLPLVGSGDPWMSLSPSGTLLVIPGGGGPRDSMPTRLQGGLRTVYLIDAAGSAVSGEVDNLRSYPAWLPGRLGAVAMSGFGVVRLYDDAGSLAVERLSSLKTGGADTVLVVPHA